MTAFACCDQNRRRLVLNTAGLNGIDWLDVLDLEAPSDALRQRILHVGFVKDPPPAGLGPANVRIDGGDRITGIVVQSAALDGSVLVVQVEHAGDFSPYVLHLANPDGTPLAGLDPLLSSIGFGFKVECPSDLECRVDTDCPPVPTPSPQIDYLAKDYDSFRRLMLDRMALTAPDWTERNAADVGVALVEVLAYVADRLSYTQDAIATEAYLGTARRRVSVKRHARLVDYAMHDGCNARVWLALTVSADQTLHGPTASTPGVAFITRVQDAPVLDPPKLDLARAAGAIVFEAMHDLALRAALNTLDFYTWGDARCCLPAGSTAATLAAPATPLPDLVGRVLIFQEMLSPTTGRAADADPSHRQAVRVATQSPAAGQPAAVDPATGKTYVEITWAAADALMFPLCVSAVTDRAHGGVALTAVSRGWGNVVLADHGLSIDAPDDLGVVPEPALFLAGPGGSQCAPAVPRPIPPRYTPPLAHGPLTRQGQIVRLLTFEGEGEASLIPFDITAPAASAMRWALADCLPAIVLTGTDATGSRVWSVQPDLLESSMTATDYVVETDTDGIARLRFGDGAFGRRPTEGTAFSALYRVGNGTAGNVGAGSVAHAVLPLAGALAKAITGVTNPLPAAGGTEAETEDAVRVAAPEAFRVQERAVTPEDYGAVSLRNPLVAHARATIRYTGSWHTVFDTIDRPRGAAVDAGFATTMRDFLERYRVIGHDLEVKGPIMVPLGIDIDVCVRKPWFRADIERELRRLLSAGHGGFFDPDAHSFGETLYLSRLYALVQSVPGVDSVDVTRFERLYQPGAEGLDTWELRFGPLEIPRCDSDPNFPGHGVLNLTVRGGQ